MSVDQQYQQREEEAVIQRLAASLNISEQDREPTKEELASFNNAVKMASNNGSAKPPPSVKYLKQQQPSILETVTQAPAPAYDYNSLKNEAICLETTMRLKLLQQQAEIARYSESKKAEIEVQPKNELAMSNTDSLRWPDWEYLAKNDFCLNNWARSRNNFDPTNPFDFAEYVSTCEYRFVATKEVFCHKIDPVYGDTMPQKRKLNSVVPIGCSNEYAAIITEDGTKNAHWRIESCNLMEKVSARDSENLEKEIEKRHSEAMNAGKEPSKDLQSMIQRKGIAHYTASSLNFNITTKFTWRHIYGKYISLVTSTEPDALLVATLPSCVDAMRVRLPRGVDLGKYEVLAGISNKLHICMFAKHDGENQFYLHYFQFVHNNPERVIYRASWILETIPTAPSFCIERGGPVDIEERDYLFWGGSDGACYWMRLPSEARELSDADITRPEIDCFIPWPNDADEFQRAERYGAKSSVQAQSAENRYEPPRSIAIAPYSRHACVISANNMSFVIRRPLKELGFYSPNEKQKEEFDTFRQVHCVEGQKQIRLARAPWPNGLDLVFHTGIGHQICSQICGNMLAVHAGNGNVTVTSLQGPAPGQAKRVYIPQMVDISFPKECTYVYQSLALSTARIVVLQPNGVIMMLVPWNNNMSRKAALANAEASVAMDSMKATARSEVDSASIRQ